MIQSCRCSTSEGTPQCSVCSDHHHHQPTPLRNRLCSRCSQGSRLQIRFHSQTGSCPGTRHSLGTGPQSLEGQTLRRGGLSTALWGSPGREGSWGNTASLFEIKAQTRQDFVFTSSLKSLVSSLCAFLELLLSQRNFRTNSIVVGVYQRQEFTFIHFDRASQPLDFFTINLDVFSLDWDVVYWLINLTGNVARKLSCLASLISSCVPYSDLLLSSRGFED